MNSEEKFDSIENQIASQILGLRKGSGLQLIWGLPKMRDTFLGVSIIRTIVFGGLYWGSHILGNYHSVLPREALNDQGEVVAGSYSCNTYKSADCRSIVIILPIIVII